MVLTKDKNKLFYLMLIAYSFFAFLSPLSPVFVVVLCTLIACSVFLFDDSDVVCLVAFASCFMSCLVFESCFLKVLDCVMGFILIKQLIIAIKLKNKKNITFICFILTFSVILFIYSLIINHFHIYKLCQSLGLILTISNIYLLKKVCIKKLTLTLSLGLIVSACSSTLAYLCGILVKTPFLPDNSSGFRFSAYFNYVNAFALYCSLCQACILSLFLSKELNIKKWFWLALTITSIGLLTFSKSFICITIFTYLVAAIIGFVKSKNKKIYTNWLLIGLLIVCALMILCHNYIEIVLDRFFNNTNYSGALNIATTGRFDIWKMYIKHIAQSPLYLLFGCGITADSLSLGAGINLRTYTPHNLFISIFYRFGIVGIIALICLCVFVLKQFKLNKSICSYLPLSILLVNVMFEDITSSLFTCLPILIASCFILKSKNNNDI